MGKIEYMQEPESDVFLFRLGSFSYAKLNLLYILQKYKASEWMDVDILIDWSNFGDKRS